MKRTIIFIAGGHPISISFEKALDLLPLYAWGVWNTDTNEVLLTQSGWDQVERFKDNPRKLKGLMEKLQKWDNSEVIVNLNTADSDTKPEYRKMIISPETIEKIRKGLIRFLPANG